MIIKQKHTYFVFIDNLYINLLVIFRYFLMLDRKLLTKCLLAKFIGHLYQMLSRFFRHQKNQGVSWLHLSSFLLCTLLHAFMYMCLMKWNVVGVTMPKFYLPAHWTTI